MASYTQDEWEKTVVFAYGRKGITTYALDVSGRVLVDATRGGQVLDYSDKIPPTQGGSDQAMGVNWAERVKAAKAALRSDGWPLDS